MYRQILIVENFKDFSLMLYFFPNILVANLDVSLIEKLGFNGFLITALYLMWKQFNSMLDKSKVLIDEQMKAKDEHIKKLTESNERFAQLLIEKLEKK